MRLPVVCVVLLISRVEVAGLETEGSLAKVVNLLTRAEFFSGDFLLNLAVAVASVAARVQGTSPKEAVSIGVKGIVHRRRNRE